LPTHWQEPTGGGTGLRLSPVGYVPVDYKLPAADSLQFRLIDVWRQYSAIFVSYCVLATIWEESVLIFLPGNNMNHRTDKEAGL
jgi:hypothetical protein